MLEEAWERVKRNKGAAGVDGLTLEALEQYGIPKLLSELRDELQAGTYRAPPVLRRYIPKPDGKQRPLGIPTVKDRIVQTALKMVIEPVFECQFAPQSYGFRPGRGCKDALRQVDELLEAERLHVVEVDIKGDVFGGDLTKDIE